MKRSLKTDYSHILTSLIFGTLLFTSMGYAQQGSEGNMTIQQLERVLASDPDNYTLRYYIGNLHLREGNRNEAIRHWEAYVALASEDSKFVSVREQLTVLKLDQASEFARNAVQQGEGLPQAAEANTIAVLDFSNRGSAELNPFIKGLTAMVITDLSKVPQLKVVERAKMRALLAEMKLAQTGIVDPGTGARVGRLLQAQTIDWGVLEELRGDNIRITTTISDTYSRSTVGETVAEGQKQKFFELEKQIVFDILAELGINREDLDENVLKALEEVETRNYDAFISYGLGLGYLDNKNYSQAKQAFGRAADLDPEFQTADTAEKTTPVVDTVAAGFGADTEREETVAAAEEEAPVEESSADTSETTVAEADTGTDTTSPQEEEPVATDSTAELFAAVEPQETTAENLVTTQDAIDVATEVRQDEIVVETENAGPTGRIGYFTNMLRNAAGNYHGLYGGRQRLDLSVENWNMPVPTNSVWAGGYLLATDQTINTLVVVDDTDPITTGLPNETVWTEMGRNAHMVWGHWTDDDEMIRQSNPTSPNGHYLFDSIGYYAYGDVTSAENLVDIPASEFAALYSGEAYGTHIVDPTEIMTGTFEAVLYFFEGTADVSDFDLEVIGTSHSASIMDAFGYLFNESEFSFSGGNWLVDGQSVGTPVPGGFGSLYGATGQQIGGVFSINADGPNAVTGIFAGDFQETIDIPQDPPPDPPPVTPPDTPTGQTGYFTNILTNTAGNYHGVYYTFARQDLTDWMLESTWAGGTAVGTDQTIDTLVVVDETDPVTIGLPNDTVWTELGSNSYMVWGHWNDTDEMVRQSNPTAPSGHYVFEPIGYFVYGDVTTTEQMAAITVADTTVTYTGDASGTHAANPSVTMTGSFTATVDIFPGLAEIADFDLTVTGGGHSATIDSAIGHFFDGSEFEIFSGIWQVDGAEIGVDDIIYATGSLYGPAAESMGGIFLIEKDTGTNSVEGIFAGSQ